MSAIVGTKQYVDYFHNPHGIVQGAIGSGLAAGSVVGSIIAGPLSNWKGRRDSIFIACFFWLAGTSVQVACNGWGMLIGGRVLNGVCVGITSSQVPVYLAEIARHDKRGAIIVIQQLAIEWGIFFMFFIGYGCSFISGPASFRTAWGMQFVPCLILMLGIPFLPRSPRWLAKMDRGEEAIEVLANIQAHGDKEDPLVLAEWEEITAVLAAERASGNGFTIFFKNGMVSSSKARIGVAQSYFKTGRPLGPQRPETYHQNKDTSLLLINPTWLPPTVVSAAMQIRTNTDLLVETHSRWLLRSGVAANVWRQCHGEHQGLAFSKIHCANTRSYTDVLRCLRLPNGQSDRQCPPRIIRGPVCTIHRLHNSRLLLHRQDRSQTATLLRCNRYGCLPFYRRRCPRHVQRKGSWRRRW
jgi:MFS family permease